MKKSSISMSHAPCHKRISELRKILHEFLKLNVKLGIRSTILGIDYSRCIEYPLVVEKLGIVKGIEVLDIGSDISLFPLFLLLQGCKVHAIDTNPRVLKQKERLKKLGISEAVSTGTFRVEIQDARTLTFQDEAFDRITLVSTLEHIPEDIEVMRQCERLLKNGGRIIVTVPYGITSKEVRNKSGLTRIYDDRSIIARIVLPSLKLVSIDYFGDNGFGKVWYSLPSRFVYLFGWLTALLSKFQTLMDINERYKAGGAVVCLEK